MSHRRSGGFTLVETMVAMIVVAAVVLPASLWLYRSRTNHAAWDRFRAVQILEDRMNRAVLLRKAPSLGEQMPGRPDWRIEIRIEDKGDGSRLVGTTKDGRGKVLASMEAMLFDRGGQ